MPASQPRVIAIVVNHNGRAFLRDTFRGLAAQTRPIDDVLVVDTGSTDGSADWARSRLGDDAVMAVRGQFGRAVGWGGRFLARGRGVQIGRHNLLLSP